MGSFKLPFATVYENDCKVEGRFRVEAPMSYIGYEPQLQAGGNGVNISDGSDGMMRQSQAGFNNRATLGLSGSPTRRGGGDQTDVAPMFIYASITLDRLLQPPPESSNTIIPGKEAPKLIHHVHKWLDELPEDANRKLTLNVMGTDIEGRSRLCCRYITPQEPPAMFEGADGRDVSQASSY